MAHTGRIDNCHGLQFDFNSDDAMASCTTSMAFDSRCPSDIRLRFVERHQSYPSLESLIFGYLNDSFQERTTAFDNLSNSETIQLK